MARIIHCADVHLDAPFSLNNPKEADIRRNELRSTFASLVLYAKTYGAEIFLIAGDLFDDIYITKDTAEMLKREFSSFPECHFFIAPGNHDYFHERSPYRIIKWPENVHIFTESEIHSVYIPKINTTVYGYAFLSDTMKQSPISFYNKLNPDTVNILLAHGDLDNPISNYCPILSKDIENSNFDYIALGHIHAASGILKKGKTSYSYCGCLEGRGFDEVGYKGAIVGEITKENVSLKGIRFSVKRYEKVEIDISGATTDFEATEKIKSPCQAYGDDTNLRIILSGVVSPTLNLSAESIKKILPKPYYLELIDNTQPILDFERLKNDHSIKGAYFKKIEPLLQSQDMEERKIAALALKYGLWALTK